MERRDWSLKALKQLVYIDSLEPFDKAQSLVKWGNEYLDEDITSMDLNQNELKQLSELFYKNINFLNKYKSEVSKDMKENKKLKKYLQNS